MEIMNILAAVGWATSGLFIYRWWKVYGQLNGAARAIIVLSRHILEDEPKGSMISINSTFDQDSGKWEDKVEIVYAD